MERRLGSGPFCVNDTRHLTFVRTPPFSSVKIFRSRFVAPIASPLIEDGAVVVDGQRIAWVGPWADRPTGGAVEDLGEQVLLPGLINAHCHLDYTGMRNAILFSRSFAQWVRRLNELKRTQTDDDYLAAIAAGFEELQQWGTTSVFNIESFPELMGRMPPPPIRTWWFYELLDIRNRIHTEEVVAGALGFFDDRPNWLGGFGLSPHAPYTTSLPLYELTRICCEKYGMPLMTHLAETQEEFDMFRKGEGKLHEFLAGLGRDMSDTGDRTPIRHLLENKALPVGALLTHMNILEEEDWSALAAVAGKYSVVHCPNCHAYFERDRFDLDRFLAIGMNVCLGTDSLASNKALNLFEEMRGLRKTHPGLSPEILLDMVTVNAAQAIGMPRQLGQIRRDAWADLIALPYSGRIEGVYESIVEHRQPVEWMLVNGKLRSLQRT